MALNLKKIWSVALTEWIKWICNPRMLIVAVLVVYIYSFAVVPLMERSVKMGQPLNMLEPLIAIGNSGQLALIIPLVFMALMSDFPKTDGSTIFIMHRTGRFNWAVGQLVFAVISIITYLGSIYVITTAFIMNRTFLTNGWSTVVKKYDVLYPQESGSFAAQLIPENLYNHMTPYSSVIQTYLLMFLYLLIIAMILLVFNMLRRKAVGFLISAGMIAFGTLFCSLNSGIMWAFPMSNAIVWLHYTDIYREAIMPISFSYIYFAVFTVVLLAAIIIFAPKINLTTIEELEG